MGNDFHDYENNGDNENRNLNTEDTENGTAWNSSDGIEGKEKNEEEFEENKEGSSPQETCFGEKGYQNNEAETQTRQEEGDHKEKTEARSDNISYNKKERKKGKGCFITSAVAVILAVAVAVMAVLPTLLVNVGLIAVNGIWGIGNMLDSIFDIQIDNGEPPQENVDTSDLIYDGGEDMDIIKNDGSIDINVTIGSTGYDGDLSVAQVVKNVADTVVEITTTNVVTDMFYNQYVTSGAGSGVIIDSDGFIITNYHVIAGAQSITVRLTDENEFSAKIVGSDANTDIAVLKIQASGLPAAVLGSSKSLVVGQEVVAIGNPLGSLGGTVTDGIISALDRTVMIDKHQMTLMQTNAAINPGNSGGGLFNRAGELIGIVNAKQADTGIEGLGFAIPIDIALESVYKIAGKK